MGIACKKDGPSGTRLIGANDLPVVAYAILTRQRAVHSQRGASQNDTIVFLLLQGTLTTRLEADHARKPPWWSELLRKVAAGRIGGQ